MKNNLSIKNVQDWWESYSKQVPDGYKDYWFDDNGNPMGEEIFKEIADFVVDKLGKDSEQKRILEIGCGTGKILSNIEEIFYFKKYFRYRF